MGKMDFVEHKSGLLVPSLSYKPFRYPWAYDFWQKQQQVHWMPEEIPLGEDCKDWATNITEGERNLLTQIFRFFTQSDIEVGANLHGKLHAFVQAGRSPHDAGLVFEHGNHPYRRLCIVA